MTKNSLHRLIVFLLALATFAVFASPPPVKAECGGVVLDVRNSPFDPLVYICPSTLPLACTGPIDKNTVCCTDVNECSDKARSDIIFCNPGDSTSGIRTALGCINASNPQALVTQIAVWALGLAVAAAFAVIAFSGFLIITAQGDAKRIAEAKKFLVSALLGLLLISIALILLNFVGVKILGLSPFGFVL